MNTKAIEIAAGQRELEAALRKTGFIVGPLTNSDRESITRLHQILQEQGHE